MYIHIYLCVYRVCVFIYIYKLLYIYKFIYLYLNNNYYLYKLLYIYISFMHAYSVMLHTYKLNWCYKYGHCEILELKLKAWQKF